MNLTWTIFVDCNSEPSAAKVATRLFQRAGIAVPMFSIESYHKGGFKVMARTLSPSVSWSEFVVNSLSLAQSVARQWILSGCITSELDAWSNSPAVPGVVALHLTAQL